MLNFIKKFDEPDLIVLTGCAIAASALSLLGALGLLP